MGESATEATYVGESAAMLIGSMAFIMCIYYLVNCRHRIISSTAWTLVNLSVSIFCAVLWYNAVGKVFDLVLGLKDTDDDTSNPGWEKVSIRLIELVIWWYFILFVFFLNRNSILRLKAYGTVGGHILGFAAIYFCGTINMTTWFRTSPWKVWLVLVLSFAIFGALLLSTFIVRKVIEAMRCAPKKEIDRWHDQAVDTKNDWLAMGASFCIAYFLRWVIHGDQVTIDGELGHNTNRQAWTLLGVAVLFLVLTVIVAAVHHSIPNKIMDLVHTTVATTTAWLLIFGLMWKLGNQGHSEVVGQVYVALILSMICSVVVFVLCALKHMGMHVKALRAAIFAFALAVGLSWEKVFDASLEAVADMVEVFEKDAKADANSKRGQWTQIFLSFFYLAIVFPAWMLYILPKDDEDIQKAMKTTLKEGPLPARACCCDEDLYEDYVDVEAEDSDASDASE